MCGTIVSLIIGGRASANNAPLNEARQWVSEWVQTRQLISRTESEWISNREMLEQTKLLFERDLASVREQTSRLSTNTVQVEKERVEAEQRLNSARAGLSAMREVVGGLEMRVRELAATLPPPVIQIVQPLLARLPENPDGDRPSVPERLQTVVGFLNEVEKFHASIHVVGDRKPNAQGEQVAVDVLYVGLATAYYVDSSGEVAGHGKPDVTGWKWEASPKMAGQIRDAIAVYRSQKPAVFVGLPVSVSSTKEVR
jgi:hypothetical protein